MLTCCVKGHNSKSEPPFSNECPTRLELRTCSLLVRQSAVMLLVKQCRNVVLLGLRWTENSELCYHGLQKDNERRREQLLELFLFLFQLKQTLTLLFFQLIKMLERGAGLTGPCLAGRQRVNGPKLNSRHLWADLRHCLPPLRTFSGLPPLSQWPVQWQECHFKSRATKAALKKKDFMALGQIQRLPRFHR